ncbi:hypothetical protein [Methanolobus psychrotolerans]|uniref:hypothetical protein n=1 Tax=Methanolobus psychrotolerans TaxID=1874706 RepID=UPI000B919BFD|nr:hypothetical protein [Methanolobus psychrotolerans]
MARTRITNGVKISAKVEGVKNSSVPLKAVVFSEDLNEVKILAEKKLTTDNLDIVLDVEAAKMPDNLKISIVPDELKPKTQIRRLSESANASVASITKDTILSRKGVLKEEDISIKPVDSVLGLWQLKHKVCGRVFKTDPVTGEKCPVPGATVHVYDVDVNFFWWYPNPGLPWGWIFPFFPHRKEEIATVKTDECGYFCVNIPYFDIDAVLRWRLRYRCLWDILRRPTVLEAIDMGVKPDIRYYPELKALPEMKVKPRPQSWPQSEPVIKEMEYRNLKSVSTDNVETVSAGFMKALRTDVDTTSDLFTKSRFEAVRKTLFRKDALFEPVSKDSSSILDQSAFPRSIAPPSLPDDDLLLEMLGKQKKNIASTIAQIRSSSPLVRLLRCWPEIVPEWNLFLDVPDIVFKVEQDIDGDGVLETIYEEGYFDVNWNLGESTTDVQIEAWSNAICVPCGPAYKPCTKTGIVGLNDMAVDPIYFDAQGYVKGVNRPKQFVAFPLPHMVRPDAEAPLCKTIRVVGCPDYGNASYYKVFYKYQGGSETHFNERWHVYNISAGTSHYVKPDENGFYEVLTPANDYFPYHTLINWRTHNYSDGKYELRLELYDAAHNPIAAALDLVKVVIDNSQPAPVDFLKLEYREAGGAWSEAPLHCPIIKRTAGTDIELRVNYNVAATHLRDIYISFTGCSGSVGSDSYWHHTVGDNNKVLDWTVTVPSSVDEGGYRFYLEGRSRAFNATGGLASNWEFDTLSIWRGNSLHVVILDK